MSSTSSPEATSHSKKHETSSNSTLTMSLEIIVISTTTCNCQTGRIYSSSKSISSSNASKTTSKKEEPWPNSTITHNPIQKKLLPSTPISKAAGYSQSQVRWTIQKHRWVSNPHTSRNGSRLNSKLSKNCLSCLILSGSGCGLRGNRSRSTRKYVRR